MVVPSFLPTISGVRERDDLDGGSNAPWCVQITGSSLNAVLDSLWPTLSGMQRCPFCAEEMSDDATVCRHCKQHIATANYLDAATARKLLIVIAGAALVFGIIGYMLRQR